MATSSRQKAAVKKAPSAHSEREQVAPALPVSPSVPSRPSPEREQADAFDRASRLFQAGKFAAALPLFEAAAQGPSRAMAHSARAHANMCARRIAASEPPLSTSDEHYDYAIALMNARQLTLAERHLLEALNRSPRADHIHYALALCRGLAGDLAASYQHLRRAIELQPRNRKVAINDPDFADIGKHPPIAELLYPGESAASS